MLNPNYTQKIKGRTGKSCFILFFTCKLDLAPIGQFFSALFISFVILKKRRQWKKQGEKCRHWLRRFFYYFYQSNHKKTIGDCQAEKLDAKLMLLLLLFKFVTWKNVVGLIFVHVDGRRANSVVLKIKQKLQRMDVNILAFFKKFVLRIFYL